MRLKKQIGGPMEFRNMKTFLRVAELQNFTKAAEELGYSQSTVTVQIQQLEQEHLKHPSSDVMFIHPGTFLFTNAEKGIFSNAYTFAFV